MTGMDLETIFNKLQILVKDMKKQGQKMNWIKQCSSFENYEISVEKEGWLYVWFITSNV